MSSSLNVRVIPAVASGDLSTKEFYACTIDGNGQVAVQTTAGGPVLGSIKECATATAAGKPVGVAVGDAVQYIAGGAITPGAAVTNDANGKVVAATLARTNTSDAGAAVDALIGSNVLGYYWGTSAAANNDIITVLRYQSIGAAPTTPA